MDNYSVERIATPQPYQDKKFPAYKYNEGGYLEELADYIDATYDEHYQSEAGENTIDRWDDRGIAFEATFSNVMKYVDRFGRKDGYNRKDLLKVLHYTILTLYFLDRDKFEIDLETEGPEQ